MKEQVCTILDIMTEALNNKPSTIGIDKTGCSEYLIERVVQRVNGWQEKLLWLGGRKFYLSWLFKQYPYMLCLSLKFLNNSVNQSTLE